DQLRSLVTGRTARYGGTTILVTILFLAALIAIYSVVKGRNIRKDLTQVDSFSLNDQTRQAIAGLALEPKVPNIKIFAFYTSAQASQKDQDTILFDDYAKTSNNKITYEFVDPDRSPGVAQQYKITGNGQLAVVPLDANNQPLVDKAQPVSLTNQENLTNAIMRVAASGNFHAYFLSVDGGMKLADTGNNGLSQLNDQLTNRFNWKTQEVSLIDLTAPNSTVKLNDPTVDGEVLVIDGGISALPDAQVKFITDYLDKGGKLAIFAAPMNGDSKPTLATADNLSTYLYTNFGVRFANNLVLDQVQAASQSPFYPAAIDFDSTHYITKDFSGTGQQAFMIFETPHSIDVAPTAPADVTVSQLVKSGKDAYAKTDPKVLTATDASQINPTDADPKGPFVLMASAENTKTGARVVLVGSQYTPTNQYASLLSANVLDLELAARSLFWTTKFDDFFSKIPQLQTAQKPQDQPIVMDSQMARTVNFALIILLPFGVLLIGIIVWWTGREKRQAT
nr:Gldg family protein [Anaerolineae bacterium]